MLEITSDAEGRDALQASKNRTANIKTPPESAIDAVQANTKEAVLAQHDVREFMRKYEVFFVHAMHKEVQTPWSSGLHKGVDWSTQLKILLALEPTLSTSTVKAGATERNFWTNMGVILNRGSVLGGGAGDIGSTGKGLRKREFGGGCIPWAKQDIEGISRAITATTRDDYNELVVESPRIAGFFMLTDEVGFPFARVHREPPAEEIFQKLETLRMPIFAITEGKIYRTNGFDSKSGRVLKEKEPVTLEEILQQPFELSPAQKEEIKEELLLDSPFISESPENGYINLRMHGQTMYIELNVETILSRAQQEGEIEIARTASEAARVRYVIWDGVLFREGERKHEKHSGYQDQIRKRAHVSPFALEKGDPLEKERIKNNEEYLLVMERVLSKLRKEGRPETLNRSAFHLYGFAEEARRFGDNETAQRAETLANQVLSKEEYSDVVARRLDAQGRFRITREELEGEAKSPVALAA